MESQARPTLPGHPIEPSVITVPRYSYYALSVLTLVNFLNYIDRQALPAVAPAMQRDLGLTDTEIGAMEAALLLSLTVLAPLFGRLGDRYSRTRLMATAAVIWSIATGLAASVDRWPVLPKSLHLRLPFFGVVALSSVAHGLCPGLRVGRYAGLLFRLAYCFHARGTAGLNRGFLCLAFARATARRARSSGATI